MAQWSAWCIAQPYCVAARSLWEGVDDCGLRATHVYAHTRAVDDNNPAFIDGGTECKKQWWFNHFKSFDGCVGVDAAKPIPYGGPSTPTVNVFRNTPLRHSHTHHQLTCHALLSTEFQV